MTIPPRLSAAIGERYRLERELGAGGMATVYLADDLRHRRKVAVKVLRPELAASLGPDRFLREIEVAAQLTHPHILPLHDSGAADGILFYVMPYIDGESLRTRLDRVGELPIGDAVRILREVADALSHAHALGVVHRDIKPDNVMLSGRHALVMDFGVAKAVSEATGRNTLTTAGVALGTPTYMAPEQAAADPHLDHRVDIYALGAMGYELLAGRPPFVGRSSQEVLSAHVTQAPDPVDRYRPGTPPALVEIIMRCLAKRPADRWQSADELVERLEPLATPSGGTTPTTTRPVAAVAVQRSTRAGLIGAIATLLVLGALGFVLARRRAPDPLVLGRRTQVTLAPELELDPALSPDGKLIAYASGPPDAMRIYVRQVAGGTPVEIAPGAEAPQRAPQWSPDGSTILYTSHAALNLVPSLGGIPRPVVTADRSAPLFDAAWAPDGKSIGYTRGDSLFRLELETGAVRGLASGTVLQRPAWSPDGRWIAYTDGATAFTYGGRSLGDLSPARVLIVPASGGPPVELAGGGALNIGPAWLGNDALVFVSNRDGARDIYRQRLRGGEANGNAERLTTGLGPHSVSVAANGSALAYATFLETVNVWSIPVSGRADSIRPVTSEQQVIEGFDVSPDGRWLVFDSNRDGNQHIFRMPLGGGPAQRLTEGAWDDFLPRYSPDGLTLGFHSYRLGERKLFSVPAEGGKPTQLTGAPGHHLQMNWAPDGQSIVFELFNRNRTQQSISRIDRRGDRWSDPVKLAGLPTAAPANPEFSPDGRFVLYIEARGAVRFVASGGGGAVRTLFERTDAPAALATWSADGRGAYVLTGHPRGSAMWHAPISGSPRLVTTFEDPDRQPTRYGFLLHEGRLYFTHGQRQADISVVTLESRE